MKKHVTRAFTVAYTNKNAKDYCKLLGKWTKFIQAAKPYVKLNAKEYRKLRDEWNKRFKFKL